MAASSLERVQRALEEGGIASGVIQMPDSTRTAEDAASACGCDVSQIVKSLVFRGTDSGSAILIMTSGANRVDPARASEQVGEGLAQADARFVREMTGFAIGGVSPIGLPDKTRLYMDADLIKHDIVWAAAGTPNAVFSIAPGNLLSLTGAKKIFVKAEDN